MKGVVFTELLEMVEDRFSLEVLDQVIERAELPSGGVYTSVGTYPFEELAALVRELSAVTGLPANDLLTAFGRHLLQRFAKGFPAFFTQAPTAFDFLERVESVIHVEVRKLYPDAQLPQFEWERQDRDHMTMLYRSPRRLSALAVGLIQGCADHYSESIDVSTEDVSDGSGEAVRLTLTRRAA
ncbi:MAG: heme NO-binding domain-containing protein [Sandaracinaceae bacterium]|nr:heme NO-binding domain-containing protein [Sandaracinaceae bacterium]MCC6873967.1 heme NO-binding domain-containing protein [Sandaracinaceae bacterium]